MTPILLLYLCMACGFAFGKASLAYMPPLLFVGARMSIAGLILVWYQFFFKKERFVVHLQHGALFAAMCLFHIYGSYALEYWAMQYVSSFKASLLFNLSPFVTALLAYFFANELMTHRKWVGLVVGFIGMTPILLECEAQADEVCNPTLLLLAEAALIGSVICAALGWIFMKRLVKTHEYSPVMINGVSMIVGGGMALITSYLFETWPTLFVTVDQQGQSLNAGLMTAFFYMALLILLCNIISYNLYGVLLRSYSATFLSFAGFLTPLFTALLSSLLFGQSPSIWFFISVAGVGLGLYLFYGEELRIAKRM
ncbi:MAG: EamA family transporter [Epsilonproteobacteria bacterium]|nr:EamA family transporter [Campylobacterota bacterium]